MEIGAYHDPYEDEEISERMIEKYKSLFKIILLYLPEKSRNFLINQDIKIILTKEKPLFNYIIYIKSIKLSHIYIFANKILGFDNIEETGYQLFAFEQELFKLFMNNLQKKIQVVDFDHQSDEDDDEKFLQDDLKRIGTALKFHAINLRELSLDFCSKNSFISYILENSINLQKLALSKNIPNEIINENIIIRNPCCPKLHTLLLYFVSISLAIKIIEKVQGNLCKIGIYFVTYDIENSGNFIKTIYQNCLNIEYVTIIMKNSDFDELENLLIKCHHLKGIIFESIYEGEDINMVDGNKLLNLLIKKSSNNLFKLGFYFNWKFDYNTLDSFFSNWKGRKSLLLETGEKNNFLLNYPGLIKKYESIGVIKSYKHQDELWNSVYIKTVLD
ncbi:8566_t:CDS:2 [Rhizophagus irregularis]|nr:8566_t:CDS:2 [Rhizophagus irregularis]